MRTFAPFKVRGFLYIRTLKKYHNSRREGVAI
nr:MAG TPA: hypothetical protein [Caudoviricetes sp.]